MATTRPIRSSSATWTARPVPAGTFFRALQQEPNRHLDLSVRRNQRTQEHFRLAERKIDLLIGACRVIETTATEIGREELEGRVDGATRGGSVFRITLPLVRGGLITVAAFSFLFAWGEFVFALSLTTGTEYQPVTVAMNRLIGQYGTQWNSLMAISTTVALPIIAVFAGLQRFIVGGLTAGATKE